MYDYENTTNKASGTNGGQTLAVRKYLSHRLSMDILNGLIRRVKLSEAREAWSYGLPVSVVPSGAYNLDEDDFKPWNPCPDGTTIPFDRVLFDQDWAGAIAEAAADGLPKKLSAYFNDRDRTMMHFEFTDHSNPYLYRGSVMDCVKEIRRWRHRFEIIFLKRNGGICYYRLTER